MGVFCVMGGKWCRVRVHTQQWCKFVLLTKRILDVLQVDARAHVFGIHPCVAGCLNAVEKHQGVNVGGIHTRPTCEKRRSRGTGCCCCRISFFVAEPFLYIVMQRDLIRFLQ